MNEVVGKHTQLDRVARYTLMRIISDRIHEANGVEIDLTAIQNEVSSVLVTTDPNEAKLVLGRIPSDGWEFTEELLFTLTDVFGGAITRRIDDRNKGRKGWLVYLSKRKLPFQDKREILVHELSHVADGVLGIDPFRGETKSILTILLAIINVCTVLVCAGLVELLAIFNEMIFPAVDILYMLGILSLALGVFDQSRLILSKEELRAIRAQLHYRR